MSSTVDVVPSLQGRQRHMHLSQGAWIPMQLRKLQGRQCEHLAHPVMSSWATAVRAIMTAVGFCICISRSSTLPSFVSLISVARIQSSVFISLASCT